ncbi:MAG: transketolase [Calditrichaeota bacterium]|nr:MAG: transketolase [Calditrichota bacterium]
MSSSTTPTLPFSLDEQTVHMLKNVANTIRGLTMDAVQKANSGHPGMPMGMADAAAVLWCLFLKHDPSDPRWVNRDRFVLSAGHGSMLLYSLLHLTGYDLPLSEIQRFRQWESKTPGHPEYGLTPGVETTTGPLGQGISNAVGLALAEKWLSHRYNREGFPVIDHFTYVIASDGDLMEGVSHESCALAGHLKLGKLIVLYDDNQISIDGSTELAFSEDVLSRFQAYGWETLRADGHNPLEVYDALAKARQNTSQPSIIACKTTIGYGSPHRKGTSKAHGEPLGEEEVKLTKQALGIPLEPLFYIPNEVLTFTRQALLNGAQWHQNWAELFEAYQQAHPEESQEFLRSLEGNLPSGWDSNLPSFSPSESMATRKASGATLEVLTQHIPGLIGGSADLTPSNNTKPSHVKAITPEDFSGRYIHYGVREHGMGAIMNGLALHGGIRPYAGTFLVFSDYMRPSIRLAAMMGLPVIYVFTHDSIGLGEDGPTHQPIEHLAALRAIPNLWVIRPADGNETVEAWKIALTREDGPTAMVLTRQSLPILDREKYHLTSPQEVQRGGYAILPQAHPNVILMASGSEVHIALEAQQILEKEQISVQVVSLPCWELFEQQSEEYQASVLPQNVTARVAIEAGVPQGWEKYVGDKGIIIGLNRFGASAPYKEIYKGLGLTPEKVAEAARRLL